MLNISIIFFRFCLAVIYNFRSRSLLRMLCVCVVLHAVFLPLASATPANSGVVHSDATGVSFSNAQNEPLLSVRSSVQRSATSSSGNRKNIDEKSVETSQALRIALGLGVLAIMPALLVSLTSFMRIIVVLSILRNAIGMPETPPNTVLIGLALFLTIFTMSPVLEKINQDAFQPFMEGSVSMNVAYMKGSAPLRDFMVRQTREQDLALMVELSKAPAPKTMEDIGNLQLVPAFMLSELRSAFQIGFVIFLPFLLIDLVVSSILMALGMMMMPPATISLPIKILMFILIDGWALIFRALVGSFH